jgi:fucose 4-O-acetylase-like acetyltransferase
LDNVKGTLIILVVVGHAIEPLTAAKLSSDVYFFIYLFHMPAFVLLCGYFSRRWAMDVRHLHGLLTDLLVPYVIFGTFTNVETAWLENKWTAAQLFSLLDPPVVMWFLLALLVWRVSSPLWRLLKAPVAMVVAVCVSVAFPFDQHLSSTLSADRIVSLMPFFVAGLLMTPGFLSFLRRPWFRAAGVMVLASVFVVTAWRPAVFHEMILGWFGAYAPTQAWSVDVMARLTHLGVSFASAVAVIAVVPRRRHWLTTIGRNSLTVYLCHYLVVGPFRQVIAPNGLLKPLPSSCLLATIVFAVGLSVCLGCEPVASVVNLIARPKRVVDWALRPGVKGSGDAAGDGLTWLGRAETASPKGTDLGPER